MISLTGYRAAKVLSNNKTSSGVTGKCETIHDSGGILVPLNIQLHIIHMSGDVHLIQDHLILLWYP